MPDLPAVSLETVTAEILILKRQTAANIIEIGRRLSQAKEMVGHGNWGAYLSNMVKFSERTAQMFMRVAREFGGNPQAIADLETTKVYTIMEAAPEDRPALIEMAPTATTRELEQAQQALAGERRKREEAERLTAETRRQLESAQREAIEAGRRQQQAEERAKTAEAKEPKVIEKPVKDTEAERTVADLRRQLKEARDELARSGQKAEEVAELERKIAELSPNLDRQAFLRDEAMRVNMALREVQDVVTRHRGLFETAKAKEYGDWIDLDGIYNTETLLEAILRDFHRITKDCVRR